MNLVASCFIYLKSVCLKNDPLILRSELTLILESTNVIGLAPLLAASKPKTPDPANRSNTDPCRNGVRWSNKLFLTSDLVGLSDRFLLVLIFSYERETAILLFNLPLFSIL